jgi:hypothetical protein
VPAGANEQLSTKLLLELPNLAAKHRLSDEQLLGCPPEVKPLSDRNEVAQLSQVQIDADGRARCMVHSLLLAVVLCDPPWECGEIVVAQQVNEQR